MPAPHDYYGPHSPEPHLHNRHNHAPYIEPDWQANRAKDQLPALSAIGRGPRGAGLFVSNVKETQKELSFDIMNDLTGEKLVTLQIPSGFISVRGNPAHTPVAGEGVKFWVDYNSVDKDSGKIVTKTTELTVPPGATGSLVYLYPEVLDRTKNDAYVVKEDDLRIYNKSRYERKPPVRVNDIVFLQTHKRHPATKDRKAWDEYFLTFGTVEAVEGGNVVFTARTFFSLNAHVSWDDIENRPEFADVAFSGDYADLSNAPTKVSDLENDVNYQTKDDVDTAIDKAVSAAYRYKGIVETYEDLPDDAENGWVYHVNQAHGDVPAGTNWAYNADEERWDALGGSVDFDGIATEEYVDIADTQVLQSAKDYTDDAVSQLSMDYNDLENKPLVFDETIPGGAYTTNEEVGSYIMWDKLDHPTDHLRRVYITQEEYDALEEKDPYTIYVTNGEGGGGGGGITDTIYVAEPLEVQMAVDAVINGRN